MECPQCLLRFNISKRAPIIQVCGHTICNNCLPTLKNCSMCQNLLPPLHLNNKLNYSLLEILEKDTRVIDKFMKICFVGSSGVGKTSLIRMLTNKNFTEDVATTVGYDFMFVDREINGYQVRFQLWDSAGQQRYRAVSPIHYKNSHIIVIVYNVCSNSADNDVINWIKQSDKHCPEDAKRILVGNKIDLIQGKIFQPLCKQAWQMVQQNKINKIQTSCKSKSGLQDFWQTLQIYFRKRKSVILEGKIASQNPQYKSSKKRRPTHRYSLDTNIPIKKKQSNHRKQNGCC